MRSVGSFKMIPGLVSIDKIRKLQKMLKSKEGTFGSHVF